MLIVCLFAINGIIILRKYYSIFLHSNPSKFPLYAALENPSLSLVVFAWKFRLGSIDGHIFLNNTGKTIEHPWFPRSNSGFLAKTHTMSIQNLLCKLGKVILLLGFHMFPFPSADAKVVTVWHCQVRAKAKITCEAMMSAEGDASHWDEGHETKHKLGLQ